MNETILNSGFPQVAPEPKPFSLYDKPSEVAPNPTRDNASAFDLTPFTFSVAEKLATAAQQRGLNADVMSAAMKGKTPMQFFDEVANKVQDVTTVNQKLTNDIEQTKAKIASLTPEQADASGYRAALDAFNNLAAQAPMAPTLERLNVSDTDKIMLGFALLTGANPNDAIGNFIKVKQGFVDQNNEQAMSQYKLDAGNFGNQIDAAGTRLTNERQLLNDTQSSMNQQFKTQMDALNNEADRLQKAGQFEEANVLRVTIQANTELNQYADDVRSSYTQSKSWSPAQDQAVDAWVQSHVQKYGGDPAQIKARLLSPLVGESTAKQTQAEDALKLRRLANDRTAWLNELKGVNMDGRVTKADIAALIERAKRFSPDNWEQLPMPVEGVDWRVLKAEADTQLGRDRLKETNRANTARESTANKNAGTSAAREDRLAGELGGDGTAVDTELPTVSRKEAGRKVTLAQGKIKSLRAKQKLEGDQKKKARYEIEIQGLAAERDYYQSLLKGEAVPFNPGAPTPKPTPQPTPQPQPKPQGDVMSTMGFGINTNPQPKVQPPPKNPPVTTKPPETPPNAGKQQPAKGVTVGKKGNKFFDEKPKN
jgi:hypothetical protein